MRNALGRGLEALIPGSQLPASAASPDGRPLFVPIERIRPNHLQPRKNFDPAKLSELSASIKVHGLAQPILVSYEPTSDTYEIIAGERRLRASELAGLKEVPVVVRNPGSEKERLSLALIENLQREDLNPIEEALGYLRLMKEHHISQGEVAELVGKAKSTVSNTLRLLDLPEDMQKAVQFGKLTEGHARALLMVADAVQRHKLFNLALEARLSVRELEDLARQANGLPVEEMPLRTSVRPQPKPADLLAIESELQESLGTKVDIRTRKDPAKGTVTLHFFSLEDFDKIVKVLRK